MSGPVCNCADWGMMSHLSTCPMSESSHESRVGGHEPMPEKNDRPAIQDLVIADFRGLPNAVGEMVTVDIETRKAVGLQRYGTLLQAFNGRDVLMDAYQEALDLAQYLKQGIEEGFDLEKPYSTALDMCCWLRIQIEDHGIRSRT